MMSSFFITALHHTAYLCILSLLIYSLPYLSHLYLLATLFTSIFSLLFLSFHFSSHPFTYPHHIISLHSSSPSFSSLELPTLHLSHHITSNHITSDEPGLLGSSRSSTRLVNSLPAGAPGSNSPSPEGLEKGGAGTGSDLVGDSNAAFGASRKRGREPTPTAEIITSSRRRLECSRMFFPFHFSARVPMIVYLKVPCQ